MTATVMWQILMLSLAVAAISTTISTSDIFAPFRRWAKEHLGKVGKVFPCTYCTSHWVAFVAVAWFHPRVFDGWWFANYVVVAFAVIAVANVVARVLRRLNDQ